MNPNGLKESSMPMKELKKIAAIPDRSVTLENSELYNRKGGTQCVEFDFFSHVHGILLRRSVSGFLGYHDIYSYLGRRFCLRKCESKKLLRSMEMRGYLVLGKRGICLHAQ